MPLRTRPDLAARYLSSLRAKRFSSQRAAAAAAIKQGLRVPHAFIAHTESRGLPQAAPRFFRHLQLLGIEPMTFDEITRLLVSNGADPRVRNRVGAMLATLRTQPHLTQQQLALRSENSALRIGKQLIAKYESGRIPDAVTQTVHLAQLVGADWRVLLEFGSVQPIWPEARHERSYEHSRPQIIEWSRTGQDGKAIGMCLALIDKSSLPEQDRAKGALCLSIVLTRIGAYHAARHFALNLLETWVREDHLRAFVYVQLIWLDSLLGSDREVDRWAATLLSLSERPPEAEVLCWLHLGLSRLRREDAAAARAAIERGLDVGNAQLSADRRLASFVALAKISAKLGERDGMRRYLHRLEESLGESSESLRGALLVNSAEAAQAAKDLVFARALYERGLRFAREMGNRVLELRAQVGLGEIAVSRSDWESSRAMLGIVGAHSHHARLDEELRRRIRELGAAIRRRRPEK